MWVREDWYNLVTGEALTNYTPDPEVKILAHERSRPDPTT